MHTLWSPLLLFASWSCMLNISLYHTFYLNFFHKSLSPLILLVIPSVVFFSQREGRWVVCLRVLRLTRAFRWMAAASQKKTRKRATATKAQSVRDSTGRQQLQCLRQQEAWNIILNFPSFFAVPNSVLTKELLTDGLKVLVSKEDELLYAARVHTMEVPDM